MENLTQAEPPAAANDIAHLWRELEPTVRKFAARALARERKGHSLQVTAVANEVFLRLRRDRNLAAAASVPGFLMAASYAVRRVFLDHARKRGRRGTGGVRVSLSDVVVPEGSQTAERAINLIDLDDALKRLANAAPRAERVVVLRFYGGLSEEEVARELGVGRRTVVKDWTFAKAWLRDALGPRPPQSPLGDGTLP